MSVKLSSYKGHPLIVLARSEEDKYPFQFGLAKAKLILEHLDAIRQFVAIESTVIEAASRPEQRTN